MPPWSGLTRTDDQAFFDWIDEAFPILANRVHWPDVPGHQFLGRFDDAEARATCVVEVIGARCSPGMVVEHVGDNLSPWGVEVPATDVATVVPSLLEVPEHHFFSDRARSWLVNVTFEDQLYVVDLAPFSAGRR